MKAKLSVCVAVLAGAGILAGAAAAASSPAVVTRPALDLTPSRDGTARAILRGTVNPNGGTTTYYFQWGLTNGYSVTSAARPAGRGIKPVAVEAVVSGLTPGTVYHFRLVAASRFGSTIGADRAFKTSGHPPATVNTGPATEVGTTVATMTGTVDPNGANTTWVFQYGLNAAAYIMQSLSGSLRAGTAPQTVSWQLQGLTPGTTFHYRLVAYHGAVATPGLDQTFMTLPSPRPVPRVTATTVPHAARRKPFVFTTYGTVVGSPVFPAAGQCTGDATIRYFFGRRQVSYAIVPIQPNCTFSSQAAFRHTFARRGKKRPRVQTLRVQIRFLGNGYLAPVSARNEHVVLG
jgi:hypothetical protein